MRKRILVVDDEDHVREVAALALETLGGHEVLQAGSSAEAVEMAAREIPDAILLDMMMPAVGGSETYDRLREAAATKEIPVVLLTAKIRDRDVAPLLDRGVAGVVTKPFDPVALADRLAVILGWEG